MLSLNRLVSSLASSTVLERVCLQAKLSLLYFCGLKSWLVQNKSNFKILGSFKNTTSIYIATEPIKISDACGSRVNFGYLNILAVSSAERRC